MGSPISIRDISNDTITHRVGASDERLVRQADASIVEHPRAMILVRGDHVDCSWQSAERGILIDFCPRPVGK